MVVVDEVTGGDEEDGMLWGGGGRAKSHVWLRRGTWTQEGSHGRRVGKLRLDVLAWHRCLWGDWQPRAWMSLLGECGETEKGD